MPMRRIRSRCCARVASGHAAAPPSSVMNSRRFTSSIRSPSGTRNIVVMSFTAGSDSTGQCDNGVVVGDACRYMTTLGTLDGGALVVH